jgi:hypothetical protein
MNQGVLTNDRIVAEHIPAKKSVPDGYLDPKKVRKNPRQIKKTPISSMRSIMNFQTLLNDL